MTRRIGILALLIGFSGPASGQMANLEATAELFAPQQPANRAEMRSVTYADCHQHYGSVRTRSEMKPSVRKEALEACRSIAATQPELEEYAHKPE